MSRAVKLAVKRCETDACEEDGANLTGAEHEEDGSAVEEAARVLLLNESEVGDGERSRVIESRFRKELEEKEEHDLDGGVHPVMAEWNQCVQENVAVSPGKIVAREGREVRAKEGKREMWVVKKDLKGRVQKREDINEEMGRAAVKREPQDYVIPKLWDEDRENMVLKKSLMIKTEVPDYENHGTLQSEVKVEEVVVEPVRLESRNVRNSSRTPLDSGSNENRKRKRERSVGESYGRRKEHNKKWKEDLSHDELRFFVGGKTGGRLLNGSRKILWAIEKESGTRIKIGGMI